MRRHQSDVPEQLLALVKAQAVHQAKPGLSALADAARARHGDSVQAVLFYGSCLRTGDIDDGLADLYLLVDDYRSAFKSRVLAFLNKLLPPNVYYLEVPFEGRTLRAKYSVLSVADLRDGTQRWFHSYLWGRFCQQCGLVYVRDSHVAGLVQESLARAVTTFITRTLPRMQDNFTARELWARGLSLSYRSELRPEQADGATRLFDAAPEYYQALTAAVLETMPVVISVKQDEGPPCYRGQIPARTRQLNGAAWRLRAVQGKILSVLRLAKGLLTFKGGVDYILWKIERHSGERIDVGPALRRLPPVAILVITWRLYRRGAFR